jgi:intracellular sulfur oxidation DsrE/DsrF family protein
MVGAGSGWLAHERSDENGVSGAELRAIQARGGRVLLHLVSGEPVEIDKALRKAELLAATRDVTGGAVQVELVVNGTGIKMLQSGNVPVAARLAAMREQHRNIRLVACNETMNRMRERGVDITLLPNVDVVPSAIEEIAARIDQGWRYMQV